MSRTISPEARFSSTRRSPAVLAAVCVLALALAAPAMAQDPTAAQYDNSVVDVQSAGSNSTPNSTSEPPAQQASGLQASVIGGLPFTGLDVIALAAVALALTSVGLALRQLSAPSRS